MFFSTIKPWRIWALFLCYWNLRTILKQHETTQKVIHCFGTRCRYFGRLSGLQPHIAKYLKSETIFLPSITSPPKIWAWERMAIKLKRDIAELFSILPFEVPFFEKKHNYPIHYVGNPPQTRFVCLKLSRRFQ